MRLPKFAIENHQFATVLVILMVLTGIVSFLTMPRSEDPQVSPPGSSVIIAYPGANPADIEELIVDPVEKALNELEDIKELKSESRDGLGTVNIEFLTGSDPDDKYSDVVQKVNSITSQLPEEVADIVLLKWSITDVKAVQIALESGSASYRELQEEAERLEDLLEKISGIKKIELWAFPQQEVRISVDMEKAAKLNVPLTRAMQSIQSNNTNIPGGNVDLGNRRFNIQTSGSYKDLDEIAQTVVSAHGSDIVYLRQIADVEYAYEDNNYYARFNGNNSIFVTATQKIGTNIFDIREQIESAVNKFKDGLSNTIKVDFAFDQSESVAHRLNNFFLNLLQGLILVGIIVILAVGFRASIIVMMVIPISIIIGIGFLDIANYGLEQMSIAGLVIALGLLVDNAIVVTENISRFLKLGYSRTEAAIKGTGQIGWAIVSSTITTLLAFVPMIMMQDMTGEFIRSMPVIVIFTLAASLYVSLTLTPYLSSKFLKPENGNGQTKFQKMMSTFISTNYRNRLGFALSKPKLVVLTVIGVFFISLSLFPLIGISFFPKAEKPQFIININTPDGTALDKTNEITEQVESVLENIPEIKKYTTNVGHGNPRIYYNIIMKRETSNFAQILVELNEFDITSFNSLLTDLRGRFAGYPGATIEIKEFEQGPPIDAPVAIKIIGNNLDILRDISKDVEDIFLSTGGAINVNNPLSTSKTDLQITINRDKAGLLGVPLAEIDRTVRAAMAGLTISKFRDSEGKEYNIVLRLPVNKKPALSNFDKIFVSSVTGAQIPLKQLASLNFKATPMRISHYNLERIVQITADVSGNTSVDEVTKSIISRLDEYNFPNGYNYYVAGELERRDESFGGMAKAVIIAMVGIFGVLVLQFRSYTQPLIVFSAIPLAIIGSIVALLLTGYSFSFTAFVGITSLVGIVINNSIILVDYTNQLMAEGKDMISALKEAGETRFVPIILTTATTVGGLLPLTLGGGTMWAPMGWTIIGGLIASTFLTLIVVPVLYKLYTRSV